MSVLKDDFSGCIYIINLFLEIKITRYNWDEKNFSELLCSSSGLTAHISNVRVAMISEKNIH